MSFHRIRVGVGAWDNSKGSAYINVGVFNAHAPTNSNSSTKVCYRRHGKEKRREYERRILGVEHWDLYSTGFVNQWSKGSLGNSCIQKTSERMYIIKCCTVHAISYT